MRFLVDVNVSAMLGRWLENRGHEVAFVASRDPRMEDSGILEWANREQRIIITTDSDFEEMIWRERWSHHGVLRLENVPRLLRITLLQEALDQYGNDLDSGAIIIALRSKFRVRRPLQS